METGTGPEWLCEVGQYCGSGVDIFLNFGERCLEDAGSQSAQHTPIGILEV